MILIVGFVDRMTGMLTPLPFGLRSLTSIFVGLGRITIIPLERRAGRSIPSDLEQVTAVAAVEPVVGTAGVPVVMAAVVDG
jgi:hypothetical protein